MGKLSTHVLDTMHGVPAQGVQIELYRIGKQGRELIRQVRSNADGRCDAPLLQHPEFIQGVYELVFHAGEYFAGKGVRVAEPRFVDQVVVRFGVADPAENFHVPLVVTPWAWSTYRGS